MPVFARGTGLGNRLFQWSRARVYHYAYGAKFVSPFWFRFSLGHLMRGTVPADQYLGRIALAGLFRSHSGGFHPLIAPWLRLCCDVARESRGRDPSELAHRNRLLYCVDGRDDSFSRLNPYQVQLKSDLVQILAIRHRRRIERLHIPPIGINIRLGKDFAPPPESASYKDSYDWVGWLQQTPLSWFLETLQLIRSYSGWNVPAVVVSDGSASQLRPLLQLPAVSLLAPSNAIVDLMVLSHTRLLLGSGSSTFSAWAAFLGQQPVFTAPGHPFSRLQLQPLCGQMIDQFDPRRPESEALDAMVNAVANQGPTPLLM